MPEAMQNRLAPAAVRRRQFEDRAVEMNPATAGRAIEITRGIHDQTGVGIRSVTAAAEVIQNLLGPASALSRQHLEHCPAPLSAAKRGRAIQIAGVIDQ